MAIHTLRHASLRSAGVWLGVGGVETVVFYYLFESRVWFSVCWSYLIRWRPVRDVTLSLLFSPLLGTVFDRPDAKKDLGRRNDDGDGLMGRSW